MWDVTFSLSTNPETSQSEVRLHHRETLKLSEKREGREKVDAAMVNF